MDATSWMSGLPSWVDRDRVMTVHCDAVGACWFDVIEPVPPRFTEWVRVPIGYEPRADEQMVTTMMGGAWVIGMRTTGTIRYTRDGDGWVRSTDGARLGPDGQPR
jgi:hypothetical protein